MSSFRLHTIRLIPLTVIFEEAKKANLCKSISKLKDVRLKSMYRDLDDSKRLKIANDEYQSRVLVYFNDKIIAKCPRENKLCL